MTTEVRKTMIWAGAVYTLAVGGGFSQPRLAVEPVEFEFVVPHGSKASEVLNLTNEGDSILTLRYTQDEPNRDFVLGVLVWTRFAAADAEVDNLFRALGGLPVRTAVNRWSGDDPEELEDRLSEVQALLIPEPERTSESNAENVGNTFSDALQNFTAEGGVVVLCDYQGNGAAFLRGAGLLDARIVERREQITCRVERAHPLNLGVEEYTARRYASLHTVADEDAVAVTVGANQEGNNITFRPNNRGGAVYIGMDWTEYSTQTNQLLANAVMMPVGGTSWLVFPFFPSDIAPRNYVDVIFEVQTITLDLLGLYRRDIVIRSNDPHQPFLQIPVRLVVTSRHPPEVVVEPDRVFAVPGQGEEVRQTLMVTNRGRGRLEAEVHVEPDDANWLCVNRRNFDLEPGAEGRIVVTLSSGNYRGLQTGQVVLSTAFPHPWELRIPVRMWTGEDFGEMEGEVVDSVSGEAVQGAVIDALGLRTVTDETGRFRIDNLPPIVYDVRVRSRDYLDWTRSEVQVAPERVSYLWARLKYGELELGLPRYVDRTVALGEAAVVSGWIANTGTGAMSVEIKVGDTAPRQAFQPWQLTGEVAIGAVVEPQRVQGAEFANGYWFVTSYEGQRTPPRIYVLSPAGEVVRSFNQPEGYALGMGDLTYDGRFLLGSGRNEIIAFDTEGNVRARIRSPLLTARALAWDKARSTIWVADAASAIYAVDGEGRVTASIPNPRRLTISAMAVWEQASDGYDLMLLTWSDAEGCRVYQVEPESGDMRPVVGLALESNARPAGFCITAESTPGRWTAAVQASGGEARLRLYDLGRRDDWVKISTARIDLPEGTSSHLALTLDSRGYPEGTDLEGWVVLDGKQRGGADSVYVRLRVHANRTPENPPAPSWVMSLEVEPNPFNRRLRIRYSTPAKAEVVLYDLQGRKAAEVHTQPMPTTDAVAWLNAEGLPSGIYMLRLESGRLSMARKVVLLR